MVETFDELVSRWVVPALKTVEARDGELTGGATGATWLRALWVDTETEYLAHLKADEEPLTVYAAHVEEVDVFFKSGPLATCPGREVILESAFALSAIIRATVEPEKIIVVELRRAENDLEAKGRMSMFSEVMTKPPFGVYVMAVAKRVLAEGSKDAIEVQRVERALAIIAGKRLSTFLPGDACVVLSNIVEIVDLRVCRSLQEALTYVADAMRVMSRRARMESAAAFVKLCGSLFHVLRVVDAVLATMLAGVVKLETTALAVESAGKDAFNMSRYAVLRNRVESHVVDAAALDECLTRVEKGVATVAVECKVAMKEEREDMLARTTAQFAAMQQHHKFRNQAIILLGATLCIETAPPDVPTALKEWCASVGCEKEDDTFLSKAVLVHEAKGDLLELEADSAEAEAQWAIGDSMNLLVVMQDGVEYRAHLTDASELPELLRCDPLVMKCDDIVKGVQNELVRKFSALLQLITMDFGLDDAETAELLTNRSIDHETIGYGAWATTASKTHG